MKKIVSLLLAMTLLLCMAACDSNDTPTTSAPIQDLNLDLAQVYTQLTQAATLPEMINVDKNMMLDLYGIKESYFTQAQVYLCADSLRADEIWLFEAVDSDALAQLKTLAQSRIDQKDSESATYDPQQNAIVKKAQIITCGNYLAVLVSPDVDALATAFKTAAGMN